MTRTMEEQMKTGRTRRMSLTAALFRVLAVFAANQAVEAQRSVGGGPGGVLMGMRDLDLTDAQRDQIRGVVSEHRDTYAPFDERLREARRALNEAVMTDAVNESKIRALAAVAAPLEADAAVRRAELNASILQILTPDQRANLRSIRAEMQARFADRGRGRSRRQ